MVRAPRGWRGLREKRMRYQKRMRYHLLAAALGIATLGGVAFAQGADPIAQRQEGLRGMAAIMREITQAVQARGDVRPLAARAEAMPAFYRNLPNLFPPGSGGEPPRTYARPNIWTDRATFEQRAANVVTETQRLQAALASGDISAVAAQLRVTGAACGACHETFRVPRS